QVRLVVITAIKRQIRPVRYGFCLVDRCQRSLKTKNSRGQFRRDSYTAIKTRKHLLVRQAKLCGKFTQWQHRPRPQHVERDGDRTVRLQAGLSFRHEVSFQQIELLVRGRRPKQLFTQRENFSFPDQVQLHYIARQLRKRKPEERRSTSSSKVDTQH